MNEMMEAGKRKYILSPGYCLRGWKLLPYAVQHMYMPRTVFFREDEWKLISACDGQTEIDWETLGDREKSLYGIWEKDGFIRPAGPGDRLLSEQSYRFYHARFKENVHWSVTGRCNYKAGAAAMTPAKCLKSLMITNRSGIAPNAARPHIRSTLMAEQRRPGPDAASAAMKSGKAIKPYINYGQPGSAKRADPVF